MRTIITIMVATLFSGLVSANELYRASSSGDKGTYYILESENLGNNIIRVLSSRIGKGNAYTDFTELKVNCKSRQYFTLAGASEDGAKEKPSKQLKDWSNNSKWVSLVSGSSKYNLVQHICKKYR